MEKEPVTKFDLEAAFKALDELDIPVAEKGIAANRVNLNETFANARNNKLKTELLVEDYYDLNSEEDLEQAQADREEEIAKAKLARIEKIVDLDAESPEDLQPSYVGKVIIQCPQCMTLFYKDPADIEPSEDDESIVNINEVCQHCGNASGYNVIGKVDAVSEEESGNYEGAEETTEETPTEETTEDELDLDFGEPTEEVDAEGTGEAETSEEDVLDLDFADTEEESEEEPKDEEEEEEKKEESLNHSKVEREAEEGSDLFTEHKTENVSLNEEAETVDESINNPEAQKEAAENSELATENHSTNLTLNEDEDILSSNPPADMPKAPVTAYFLDCSGSWGPDGWKEEMAEIERLRYDEAKGAAKVKVFYFSDKVYSNMADARHSGASNGAGEIARYAKEHPEEKCIVRTDDDYKGQCSPEDVKDLETLPNIELRLRKLGEELTEDVDLDKKLKEHNEYIDYLKKMIEQEEEALKKATNDEVKAAIQRRLDAFAADLEAALPEAVKNDLAAEDLPTPEEAGAEEEQVEESVNKSENTAEIAKDELPDAKTLHEEVVTVTVDSEPGREPIVTVATTDGTPAPEAPIDAPVCVGPECETPCVEPECETPCVGPECDAVPPVVADVPAIEIPTEVSTEPVEVATAPVDDIAAEFGINTEVTPENEEPTEEKVDDKVEDDKDDDDDDKGGEGEGGASEEPGEDKEELDESAEDDNLMKEMEKPISEEEVRGMMSDLRTEDINITNNDSPGRADNRTMAAPTTSAPTTTETSTEEGLLTGVGSIVNGLSGAAKEIPIVGDLLASDAGEKKNEADPKEPLEECGEKTEEGLGLFGIGDVNVNLDASGQNNAVGFGGGEAKTEAVEEDELDEALLTEKNWFTGIFQTPEHRELNKRYKTFRVIAWNADASGAPFRGAVADGGKTNVFPMWDSDHILGKIFRDEADVQKAMKHAATMSQDIVHTPLADVYGMTAAGVPELLYTYKGGKQLTDKEMPQVPDVKNGGTGLSYNYICYVKAKDDLKLVKKYEDKRHTASEVKAAAKAEKTSKGAEESNVMSQLVSEDKYAGKWTIKTASGTIVKPVYEHKDIAKAIKTATDFSKHVAEQVFILTDTGKQIIVFDDGKQTKGANWKDLVVESFKATPADLSLYEDVDEVSVSEHITESLTKVYENVDKFEMTACTLADNKFIIEGTITFKSAKTRPVKYVFTEAVKVDEEVYLKGINESLSTDGTFVLKCSAADNKLVAEGLAYNYSVNDTLVEGYTVGK